ncbi:MAG TPA: hypothetical protein ENI07_24760 [Desulfobacterales bacterium]|nr:hypothetical protein [Desulfobacterales bacterium]
MRPKCTHHCHDLTLATLIACFAIMVLIPFTSKAAEKKFEAPPKLRASDILPEKLLKSPNYQIDEQVINDGFLNHYHVTSPFGDFDVISNAGMHKLAREIDTITEMAKVKTSDVFIKAVGESASKTLSGIKTLFTDPEKSIKGAATGISSLFSRAKESVLKSDPGETEDSKAKQAIGFSKAKREIAFKYGVDVYSTNKVLQEYLDSLAWADYLGGLSLAAVTAPIGGAAGLVVTSSGAVRLLNEVIATTPPAELKLQNRNKLLDMSIDGDLIHLFINNPHFSPRQQTYLVAALEKMTKAKNREFPLQVALQAENHNVATTVTLITAMFAAYSVKITPIERFYPVARFMYGLDENGKTVLQIPADYITWNQRLANGIGSIQKRGKKGSDLWLLGTVSERARIELKQAGWEINTRVATKLGVAEEKLK